MHYIKREKNIKASSVETAIKRELKRSGEEPKFHPNTKLSISVEACIAGVLLYYDRIAAPMSDLDMLELAKKAFPEHCKTLSENWCHGFRKRWSPWLKKRKASAMDIQRVASLTKVNIDGFISSIDRYWTMINASDGKCLVNADEVPCSYAGIDPTRVYTAFGRPKSGSLNSRKDDVRTFIPFTAATGQLLMLVVVFKTAGTNEIASVFVPEEWASKRHPPFEVYYAATTSGYINGSLWKEILSKFHLVSLKRFGIGGCVLLTDNLAAHVSIPNVRHAVSLNIHPWLIPPHSSHFLQPNDNGVNAVAKSSAFKAKSREIRSSVLRGITPSAIISRVLLDAITSSITPQVIRASWARVGIWPWDPELIRSNAEPYLAKQPISSSPAVQTNIRESMMQLASSSFETYHPTPVKKVRVKANARNCYTPADLFANHEAKEKAKLEKKTKAAAKKADVFARKDANLSKKALNIARRSTLEEETPPKKMKGVAAVSPSTCFKCKLVPPPRTSWYSCSVAKDQRLCYSCYKQLEKDALHSQLCPLCCTNFCKSKITYPGDSDKDPI